MHAITKCAKGPVCWQNEVGRVT
uniref:Uncharacterized protein n=1 Tax=Rhizophora mucronata TaxID=61149 RepID=A0A2P2MLK4_RHIMU